MKQVKLGREIAKRNTVGLLFVAAFGIFWCFLAMSLHFYFMIPFGILFVGFALYSAAFSYRNATSETRESIIDIEDTNSYDHFDKNEYDIEYVDTKTQYCPYCGRGVKEDYTYCPSCGQKLPEE